MDSSNRAVLGEHKRNLGRIHAVDVQVGDLAYDPGRPENMPMMVERITRIGRFVVMHNDRRALSLVEDQTMLVVH